MKYVTCAVVGSSLLSSAATFADVTGTLNAADRKAISPLIYGSNDASIPSTLDRLGGNRWSAYNWENNASNAGADFNHQNDAYLVRNLPAAQQNVPGAAVLGTLQSGKAALLTVPILGYAAADKNGGGDVAQTPNYLNTRFKQVVAQKPGGNLSLTPDVSDAFVYTDEFANWVKTNKRPGQQVLYNLDNEPDLWSETHPRIHPGKVTYDELVQKNIAHATAIKNIDPSAKVLGAVNYGWDGYRNLQLAPDRAGKGDFQAYYLRQMKAASDAAGKRLVDALDFHYYPEAQGTNAAGQSVRIVGNAGGRDVSPGVAAARMAAPRSLWDATYVERSYIQDTLPAGDKAIRLLPRTQQLIDQNYAGTGMAITEYNFGGGDHISGGIAQADALGVFGEQGLAAATWWDLGHGSAFVNAAQRMYLNYDGEGGRFGDVSVGASSSDDGSSSFYAALDSGDPKRLTLVLINKSTSAQIADLSLRGLAGYTGGEAFQINASSAVVNGVVQISDLGGLTLSDPNRLVFNMAPLSVTTIALVPEPAALATLGFAAVLLRRRR